MNSDMQNTFPSNNGALKTLLNWKEECFLNINSMDSIKSTVWLDYEHMFLLMMQYSHNDPLKHDFKIL